jgi:uncharacterized protein YbjT (DUF2867 family)
MCDDLGAMTPPNAATQRQAVLVAGATGLVGRALVQQLVARPGHEPVHLMVRRPHEQVPRGAIAHVVDFARLPVLPPAREAYCALGSTIRAAGSQAAFRAVDHDAVLAFAEAARAAGVRRFAVVSALGAHARSRNFYGRVKGETEADLRRLGFEMLVVARPSLLAGDRSALDQAPRLGERLALAIAQPLSALIPTALRPIPAETVARALIAALHHLGPGVHVLDSARLHELGAA